MAEEVSKAQPDLAEVNDLAAQIARDQAGDLIRDISETKRKVVRRLVARGLDEGWSDAVLRQRIAEVAGLDERSAEAVQRFRAEQVRQGKPKGRVERLTAAYAKRLRAHRAMVITRTETQRALLTAQRAIWAQQQADGDLSRYAVRVWRTHKDERMCPVCRPMNGQRTSLKPGATYNVGRGYGRLPGPPAHPNCRCYEDVEDQGVLKTDPALWGPEPVAKHLRGLHPQKTHGRRHVGLTDLLDGDIADAIASGDQAKAGFTRGVRDILAKYPNLRDHLVTLRRDKAFGHIAVTRYLPGGIEIIMNPKKMHRAAQQLQDKMDTGYVPWGVPEVQGIAGSHVDPHDYAYGVAVHEMGHVAHLHVMARWIGGGKLDDLRNAQHNGYGMTGVPNLTPYAAKNRAEAFAEWFAAYQFRLVGPEHGIPDEFVDRVKQALDQPVVWDQTNLVVKEDAVVGEDVEDDYTGSVVETYAVRGGSARVIKHLPGLHDQKSHGRRFRGLRKVPAQRFLAAFNNAFPPDSPFRNHVSHYTLDEAKKMTPLVGEAGKVGLMVKDHGDGRIEATALFNNGGSKGAGARALLDAVENHGVNYVECFGPYLNTLYSSLGFVITDEFPFDPDQAPPDWDYDAFDHPNYYLLRWRDDMSGITKSDDADDVERLDLDRIWDDAIRQADKALTDAERKVRDNLLAQARMQW